MNKETLLSMLEYAALSYQDNQPLGKGIYRSVINDEKTGVQCYLYREKDILTIVFRGTDSNTDLKRDLLFCKKIPPYNNTSSKIKVHSGFLSAYQPDQVRGCIQKAVTEYIHSIRITGHSLGAAMAMLCAADLQYRFPHKDYEVVLFGCPRVGNRAFSKFYNESVFKTLRVENGNDLITKLPPALFGYRHAGICIHTGHPKLPVLFSLRAHRMQNYYTSLWKQL